MDFVGDLYEQELRLRFNRFIRSEKKFENTAELASQIKNGPRKLKESARLKFALIGKNIGHSKSPEVYKRILGREVDYALLDYETEKDIPDLRALISERQRISVTAPYKSFCFRKCAKTSELAKRLEAVNALALENDLVVGENTDALAVRDIFRENYSSVSHVLLLGDGTMSRVVKTCAPEKIYHYSSES